MGTLQDKIRHKKETNSKQKEASIRLFSEALKNSKTFHSMIRKEIIRIHKKIDSQNCYNHYISIDSYFYQMKNSGSFWPFNRLGNYFAGIKDMDISKFKELTKEEMNSCICSAICQELNKQGLFKTSNIGQPGTYSVNSKSSEIKIEL